MINETTLLQRYDKDIRRIVNRYLYSTQFSSNCSFYEDLISEAFVSFLIMCRTFDLQSYELTDLQRAMCKKKIESTLRVYIWKMFNMGGYNNRKIDLSRSTTISDVIGDTGLDLDEAAPNTYLEDFSIPHVDDFMKILNKFDIRLLFSLISGKNIEEIAPSWGVNQSSMRRRLYKIRKKYINYENAASAA